MASTPKFSVAIVGGGIGGVTLAVALSKYPDIQFNLYEAAAAFEEIGAGVGIFARSVYALEDMGIAEALDEINTPSSLSANAWDYRKADVHPTGKDFARRFYATDRKASGNYHRAQFLSLLVSLLPKRVQEECIHFKKRLARYEQGVAGVTLYFTDGTTSTGDVLIGADGIKSPTRYGIFAERAAPETDELEKSRLLKAAIPRWSGMVAYRGLLQATEAEALLGEPHRCTKDRLMYCGKDAHLVVFPIAMGKMINVVAFVSKNVLPEHKATAGTVSHDERTWPADRAWVEPAPPEEMLEAYEGYEEQVLALLKAIKTPSRWAIHELEPLPFYTHGNVALLGDAAHATQPHQGQGANQSIEDAYILSLILASPHTAKETIPRALKAYERARLNRANDTVRLSLKSGKMHQFVHFISVLDFLLIQLSRFNMDPMYGDLDQLKPFIEGTWNHWLFLGSPKADAEAAIDWMLAA
ncbi:FAD/NAD-P-binding domain-containing protein [Mycena floridula]|nr:FAD/NAD-P-binding domain-containing protein [Mycena floridula]